MAGEGRAQRDNPQRLPPPISATLGYQRPEGFVSTAGPLGTPGLRASRRAGPKRAAHAPETGARASGGGQAPRGRAPPRARAEGPGPSQGPFARGLRVHISPVAQNVDLWRKNYRVRRRRLATDPSGLPGTGLGPPDPGHHPIPASDRSGWATWSTPEAGEPRRQARRATRRDEMRYSPLQRSQARAGAATNYRASELGLGEGA